MVISIWPSGVAVAVGRVLGGEGVGLTSRVTSAVVIIIGRVSLIGAVGVVASRVIPTDEPEDVGVAAPAPAQAAVRDVMATRMVHGLREIPAMTRAQESSITTIQASISPG